MFELAFNHVKKIESKKENFKEYETLLKLFDKAEITFQRRFLVIFDVPAETINLDACSNVISKKIKSFLGTINKNPLVGFGVVGKNTFISSSLTFLLIIVLFVLVAKPTAHTPFFGVLDQNDTFLIIIGLS